VAGNRDHFFGGPALPIMICGQQRNATANLHIGAVDQSFCDQQKVREIGCSLSLIWENTSKRARRLMSNQRVGQKS
jgi:hypothetical protein